MAAPTIGTAPDGFVPHTRTAPLSAPWEPIYARHELDRVRLGLWTRPEHTNSRGVVHGGLIAALADAAMGLSLGIVVAAKLGGVDGLVTTSLTVDYLAKVELHRWLEIDTHFVHFRRTQGVTESRVLVDGEVAARANGRFSFTGRR